MEITNLKSNYEKIQKVIKNSIYFNDSHYNLNKLQ